MTVIQCPGRENLVNFMLGKAPEPMIEKVGSHVESCPTCMATLVELSVNDTLVDAIRTDTALLKGAEQDAVRKLVANMQSLHASASKISSPEGGHTSAFASAAASSSPGGDTIAVAPPADDGDTEEDHFSPPVEKDEIGRLANYRILRLLGAGGMGKVFLAEDLNLHRKVAMKVMKRSLARNAKAKQRFLQEARLAASIEHDHIVPIYQVGEDRGIPFLAMPLLNGASLDELLAKQKPLKVGQMLRIGIQIAEGLQAAHEKGLIHRDIKPANIWIEPTGGGRVKILDFGLARNTTDDVGLTQTGAIMGTPAYMSPEQARGEKLDGRCDVYSLGCVMYRMATGELPIKGNDTISLLMALALHDPLAPHEIRPDLPRPLSEFIMNLVAKDRQQRPATAIDVVSGLKAIQKSLEAKVESPTIAVPFTPPREASTAKAAPLASPKATTSAKPKGSRPNALIATAIGLVAALLIAAGVVFFLPTSNGIVRIEVDDPKISFKFDDKGTYTIVGGDAKEVSFSAGPHVLKFKLADGNEIETDRFTLKKNDKIVVKVELLKGKIQVVNNDAIVGEKEIAKAIIANPANPGPVTPIALKKGTWNPDKSIESLPGLVPHPAFHRNIGRWQIMPTAAAGMRAFAESPDGRWIAAWFPPYVSIYDAKTGILAAVGKETKVEAPLAGANHELEWTPDSKWVRSGYRRGFGWDHVHFFDTSGSLSPAPYVQHMAMDYGWNPKQVLLAMQDEPGKIRLFDPATAKPIEFPVSANGNAQAAWSPDGDTLVVLNGDKTGQLFGRDGKPGAKLEGECDSKLQPVWVDGGTKIAALSSPTELRYWTKEGRGGGRIKNAEPIQRIMWYAEKKVLGALDSQKLSFWNLDGGRVIQEPIDNFQFFGNWVHRVGKGLYEVPNGEPKPLAPDVMLIGSNGTLGSRRIDKQGESSLEVFRLKGGEAEKAAWKIPYSWGTFIPSKDEKRLYVGDADGLVSYDLSDAKKIVRFGGPTPGDYTQCVLSPKGDMLALGSNAGQIVLCNPLGQPIAAPMKLSDDPEAGGCNHPGAFVSLQWAPDGRHLVAAVGSMVHVFDALEGKRLAKASWRGYAVFSPDNSEQLVLTTFAQHPNEASVWRWKHEREPSRRVPATLGIATPGFDGKTLLCQGLPSTADSPHAYLASGDLKTLTPVFDTELKPQGHSYWPPFALLPDGKSFLAGTNPLSIRSLDGKLLERIEPGNNVDTNGVNRFLISPDGKSVVAWAQTRFFRLNLADKKVTALPNIRSDDGAAAFSPDGKYLITLRGSALQYWNLESRELEQIVLHLPHNEYVVLSPAGETLARSKDAERHLRYIIEDQKGSLQLKTPSEFEAAIR